MKISQSFLDSKDGSNIWWLPWFPKITHPKHFWPKCTAKIGVKSPCVLWPCFYRLRILLGATINALIWFDSTHFIVIATDYGRPMKFSLKSRTLWLWQTNWQIFSWTMYQHPFWYSKSMFTVIHKTLDTALQYRTWTGRGYSKHFIRSTEFDENLSQWR